MEWAGQTYSSPPLRAVAWRSRTPTRVGCSNEFVAPRVRAVHLPAAHLARHVRARHLDGRGQVPIAVAVDQRDRDLAAGLVAAGDRVDHRERPQVRDVVHAPAARVHLPLGRQDVLRAVDVHVEGDRPGVLGVESERVVDRLQEQTLAAREDRGDRVHELGEVGHADHPAVADEAVEVRGHREGVGEGVALLHPTHPVLVAAGPPPYVPLVEGDVDRVGDLLHVADPLDQRRADAHRALGLV